MAFGSPKRPARPVTVAREHGSGSDLYVNVKHAAAQFDDLGRMNNSNTELTLGMIENAASISDSIVAGIGSVNPWLAPWMPRLSPFVKQYNAAVRSVASLWSNAQREVQEPEWLRSVQHADNMIAFGKTMPADAGVNERLNNRFFTHVAAPTDAPESGALLDAAPTDIRRQFAADIPSSEWPNLILTSSHALVRDHRDVSQALEGFHSLIAHCYTNGNGQRGADLPLIRDAANPTPATGKRTLMVAAVHNDHNAWVNGGNLLKRLWQLDQMYEQSNRGIVSQDELEAGYLKGMSPAATRLGKLIFSLIVEDPRGIDLDSPALCRPREPFRLRPDAPQVLQHIKLAGYSKGGNIVTDAVRHLILQLQVEGAVEIPTSLAHAASGQPPVHAPDQAHIPMGYDQIAPLIRNMGILCINPGICPLTEREKSLGIRRISIRNNLDRISAHLFRRHEQEHHFGTHDDVYVINGRSMGDLGHSIEAAMGTAATSGYLTNAEQVDEKSQPTQKLALSRLRAFFASCYNQIGISDVAYDPARPGELGIEFSTGTSDTRAAASIDAITQAMEAAGLDAVSIHSRRDQRFSYALTFSPDGSAAAMKQKLIDGFATLCATRPDIHVSGTVFLALGTDNPTPYIDAATAQIHTQPTRIAAAGR